MTLEPTRGVRSCARRYSFVLAVGLALACRPESSESPVFSEPDVSIEITAGGLTSPGSPASIRVDARNTGASFDGTITLRGLVPSASGGATFEHDPVSYSTRVAIARGTRKRIEFPLLWRGWEAAEISFESQRSRTTLRRDFATLEPALLRVLVVAEEEPALPGLSRLARDAFESGADGRKPVVIRSVRPRELPGTDAGFGACHLVILWRTSLAGASPRELAALESWVRGGGTVVSFPDESWSAVGAESLRGVFGIEALAIDASPPALGAEVRAGTLFHRRLELAADARLLEGGLYASRRIGAGRALTSAFSPIGDLSLAKDSPVHRVLEEAIARGVSFAGASAGVARLLEGRTPTQLREMTGFRSPSAGWIFFGLVGYLAVGFVMPAVIWRRSPRRERIFLWVLLASISASVLIYWLGVFSAVADTRVVEVSLVRASADGSASPTTSFIGIIAPRVRRVTPNTPLDESAPTPTARTQLAGPLRAMNPLGDFFYGEETSVEAPSTRLQLDDDRRLSIPPQTLFPNASRFFRYDHHIDAGSLARFRWEDNGDLVLEHIQERERLLAVLIDGDQAQQLRSLRPGESARIPSSQLSISRPDQISLAGNVREIRAKFAGLDPRNRALLPEVLWAVRNAAIDADPFFTGGSDDPWTRKPRPAIARRMPRAVVLATRFGVWHGAPEVMDRVGWTAVILEIPTEPEAE